MSRHSNHCIKLCLLAVILGWSAAWTAPPPSSGPDLPAWPDWLGVAHVAGKYHFTNEDFLNEGAAQVQALGSRVIKVYLTLDRSGPSRKVYAFNTKWPDVQTLAELAQTPPFRRLFARPFTTFILTTFGPPPDAGYWRRGITAEQESEENRQFHDLTCDLLRQYRSTGKTFILQNWEGDWAVRGKFDAKMDPTPESLAGMIRWARARQAGVDRARKEVRSEGVRVLHALEVNLVKTALLDNRPAVVNRVLPQAQPDLVSYSAWDTQDNPALLRRALDYIARHSAGRPPFGKTGVYIGEFGAPENQRAPEQFRRTITTVVTTAREWGCPYVVYWQLYCNEALRQPVRVNGDVRGFWLRKPEGQYSWAWDYFAQQLKP